MATLGAAVNSGSVIAALKAVPDRAQGRLDPVTRSATFDLQRLIRGNASGRPGPRVRTGDYRRAWQTGFTRRPSLSGGSYLEGFVRNNRPQAWRLERGFVGRDAIGRLYNQPAFPHVAPAVADLEPRYVRDCRAALARPGLL